MAPDWAPLWGHRDRVAASSLTGTLLPSKVAPKRAAWPGAGSGCRVTIFLPFQLVCAPSFHPLSLRPSPLPPHVGTAPLDQAFFLSSSSSCWKGPEFSFFFFSSHLRGILITSPFSFTKMGVPSLDWFYSSPLPGGPAQAQTLSFENFLCFSVQSLVAGGSSGQRFFI